MAAQAVAVAPGGLGTAGAFDAVILAGGRGSRLGGVSKGDLEVGGRRLVDTAVGAAREFGAGRVIVVGDVEVDAPTLVVREDHPFGGPAAGLAAGLPCVSAPWLLLLACDLPRASQLVELLANASGLAAAGREASADRTTAPDEAAVLPEATALVEAAALAETAEVPAPAASSAAPRGTDGFVVIDGGGRTQWLAGLYRVHALRRAFASAIASDGGSDGAGDSDSNSNDGAGVGNRAGDGAAVGASAHGLPIRRVLELLDLTLVPDLHAASEDIDTPEQLAAARAARARGPAEPEPHRPVVERRPADASTRVDSTRDASKRHASVRHASTRKEGTTMADKPKHLPPEALDDWLAEAKRVLDIDDDVDVGALLDVAKDVAHNVARPAAPLTTFALGLALGRQSTAADSSEVFARLAERVTKRAIDWEHGA